MSLADIIEREARLIVLKSLADQPNRTLNSSLLSAELAERWAIVRTRDWLAVQLAHLADLGAVTLIHADPVKIATLTRRGLDHVEGRIVIEGVKRPEPPEA